MKRVLILIALLTIALPCIAQSFLPFPMPADWAPHVQPIMRQLPPGDYLCYPLGGKPLAWRVESTGALVVLDPTTFGQAITPPVVQSPIRKPTWGQRFGNALNNAAAASQGMGQRGTDWLAPPTQHYTITPNAGGATITGN